MTYSRVSDWKQYQEDTALLFRGLGFHSETDVILEGARGKHALDVLVKGSVYGIDFSWVIECKLWKSNVPKEKVLALLSIVQDVGADKGFLFSEIGFQAGAIRMAKKSNISLGSLADLRNEIQEEFLNLALEKQLVDLGKLKFDLLAQKNFSYIEVIGRLAMLELATMRAMRQEFPVVYEIDSQNQKHFAHNATELLSISSSLKKTILNSI
jgi:hypothetical protein